MLDESQCFYSLILWMIIAQQNNYVLDTHWVIYTYIEEVLLKKIYWQTY